MSTIRPPRPDINSKTGLLPMTWWCPQGASGIWATSHLFHVEETTSGTNQRRKPKGRWITPTPYTFERIVTRGAIGTARTDHETLSACRHHRRREGFVGSIGLVSGSPFRVDTRYDGLLTTPNARLEPIGLRNQALISALTKLKKQQVNLGVAYGERKQTARLLGDTAKRTANAIRALKRGQIRKAMNELGISSKRREPRGINVPSKWLELQYGWKPLLGEVYGSADALSKRTAHDWMVTVKAYRSEIREIGPQIWGLDSAYACIGTCRVSNSVFVRIDVEPENEVVTSLSSLGVLNPLIVAWELLPFSFIYDWFIPVGEWLNTLDSTFGYKAKGYSNTMLTRAKWRVVGFGGYRRSNQPKFKEFTDFEGVKDFVRVDRQASVSTPIPSLPSFKDPRTLGRMANALALLATAVGRR